MKQWLNTLTNNQLKTWIKNMEITSFFITKEERQNIDMAKQILKSRGVKWVFLLMNMVGK